MLFRSVLIDDIVDSAGTLCNAAVALMERGEVAVFGEKLTNPRLQQAGKEMFDAKGRVIDAPVIAEMLVLPRYPEWAPYFMVESPWMPLGVAGALLAASVEPYASATIQGARYAAEQGVPVIALTDSAVSPLAQLASIWMHSRALRVRPSGR